MNKFSIVEFVKTIFDGERTAEQDAEIGQAILTAASERILRFLIHNGPSMDSRNHDQFRAFASIQDPLRVKPLALDREFRYLELLLNLIIEQLKFVIRLN